jgi:uncharacterized protein YjbI with pentapeptide repeats
MSDERDEGSPDTAHEAAEAERLKAILTDHAKWLESEEKGGKQADFTGARLQDARFQGANLRRAIFRKARLRSANFQSANLQYAEFQEANLIGANLSGADLRNANLLETDLRSAKLEVASLSGANLQRANLEKADLQEANLIGANLQGANLQGANCQGAKAERAEVSSANLEKANLVRVRLKEADLTRTNLKGANLDQANLQDANISEGNLEEVYLCGADLQKAYLIGTRLHKAVVQGANFQNADLTRAILNGSVAIRANFQNTKLFDAKLEVAKLIDADLRKSGLKGADLENADLTRADLRNADLSDAQLGNAKGLISRFLGGADLSNAKLPEDIGRFEGVAHVSETAQNARRIFQAMLAGCVYSWLTVATTTDAKLLSNSASSPLPIIQTEVPIAGFFWVAPLILLAVYFWLQLYLQRLWEGLAALPAVFPDGKALPEKAYPWLPVGLVSAHVERLRASRPPLSKVQNFVSIVLLWWVVPFTLAWFWGRYIPRHDWFGTILLVTLFAVASGFGFRSYWLARRTLRGHDVPEFPWKRPWADWRSAQVAGGLAAGAVFLVISLGAIEGTRARPDRTAGPSTWMPYVFEAFGYRTYAELQEAEVSQRPKEWWRAADEKQALEAITGAKLSGSDLREARAWQAFLAKADLSFANLQGADLRQADLKHANLFLADLRGAHLLGANLQQASLVKANLEPAYLPGANLLGANLQGVKLRGANLVGASLLGADLNGATLEHADLSRAKLEGAQLQGANLFGANLRDANLREADLTPSDISGALRRSFIELERLELTARQFLGSLRGATNLQGADLTNANLQKTNFQEANLRGTILASADLSTSKGLTAAQLSEACGNEETKLPSYLPADFKLKPCPEKPKQ